VFEYFQTFWDIGLKVTIDGDRRLIIVDPSIPNISIKTDIYSAWKKWAQYNIANKGISLLRYPAAMRSIGGDPTTVGQQAGDIYFLRNNWRLQVDFNSTQVSGVLFSDDFETAYVTANGEFAFPPQVTSIVNTIETTQVNSITSSDYDTIAESVWNLILAVSPTISGSAREAVLDSLQQATLSRKLLQNRTETDPDTGIMTVYDDDDSTVLFQGDLFEDVAAAQRYRGQGADRRNRLV
jgi:hypothetical protein